MKNLGTGILSIGIMAYYLFFKDETIRKAVKVSNVLWAYEMTRNILSGDAIAGGYTSTAALKATVPVFVFAAFAMTQEYADTVIKATSILWGLSGLQCIFAPESAKSVWNFAKSDDDEINERTASNCSEFGVFLLSTSILSASLVFFEDMTKTKALGLAGLPWLLWTAKSFADGTFDKYGVNINMMLPWLLYHVAVAVTCLL